MLKPKFWKSHIRTYQKVNLLPRENFIYIYVAVYLVLLYLKYFKSAHPKFESDTTVQANENIENYKCNKDI